MSLATVAFLREKFASLKTLLAAEVVANIEDAEQIVFIVQELVGYRLFTKLTTAFRDSLNEEVLKVLNTDTPESVLSDLSTRFWARMSLPVLELNEMILSSLEVLNKSVTVGEKLAKVTAELIKNSGYERADDIVYGLASLVEYDRWFVEKVRMTGVDGLAQRVSARALETALSFARCSMDLTFAWISSASAALGIVKRYRRENMHYLAGLCRELAHKLDAYMDTLDMVVDDELYEDLVRLGVVDR